MNRTAVSRVTGGNTLSPPLRLQGFFFLIWSIDSFAPRRPENQSLHRMEMSFKDVRAQKFPRTDFFYNFDCS